MAPTRRAFLRSLGKVVGGVTAAPFIATSKLKASEQTFDALIVGSGFCGTAIAERLASTGARIALIETGDSGRSRRAQILNKVTGSPPMLAAQLSIATLRGLGGTSALWNSSCPIPEAKDFHSHTHFGYGVDWPIGFNQLRNYLVDSANWLRVGVPKRFADLGATKFQSPFSVSEDVLETLHQISGLSDLFPAAMGTDATGGSASLRVAPLALGLSRKFSNVQLMLNTHVSKILFTKNRASGALAHLSSGGTRRINARHVIIACGGTQNARLLQLSADDSDQSPLRTHSDLLGRHLMDHPYQHIIGKPRKELSGLFQKETWLHSYDRYMPNKREGLGANIIRVGFIPPYSHSQFIGGSPDSELVVIDSMWEQEALFENSIKPTNQLTDRFGSKGFYPVSTDGFKTADNF